jgi:predicted NBD/HSP70 family sugar kinase
MGASTSGDESFAGTPSLLRAINERTLLDAIRDLGPVSRAQLARHTGLSKPTVSQGLAALHSAGLLREAGRTSGGKGPTAVLYELNSTAGWVVGIDVGHSFVRAAIANLTGDIVARRDERTQVRSSSALIEQVGAMAHGVASDAGIRWKDVTHATLGSPGVFDEPSDHVALAHNLPGWGRPGLVEAVRDRLGTRLSFENDVNLAAVGEYWRGLGKGIPNFVYLHVGTGVGMGLVINHELFRGATGAAGEIGYVPLVADPHARTSRLRGSLESAAGAAGVVDAAKRLGMAPPLTARKVFAAARKGDAKATKVVATEAERIALAIAAVIPVVDPELVILGGGIGRNGDLLLEPVRTELHGISPFHPRVEVSALGEDATIQGAVSMALHAAQEQLFARGEAGVGRARPFRSAS